MDKLIALFQKVLHKAKEMNVSDVHLSVGSPWKFRQHGHVAAVKSLEPLKMAEANSLVRHLIEQTHRSCLRRLKNSCRRCRISTVRIPLQAYAGSG